MVDEGLEVGLSGEEIIRKAGSLVLNIIKSILNDLDDFIDSTTRGQVEFDSGDNLRGDSRLLCNEAESLDSDRVLGGFSRFSEGNS